MKETIFKWVGPAELLRVSVPAICMLAPVPCFGAGWFSDLGTGTTSRLANARDVSSDGGVVVGEVSDPAPTSCPAAFRWTAASGALDRLGHGRVSYARGVSADGRTVVGVMETAPFTQHAFRWSEMTGTMQDLGTLSNGDNSEARGGSADGRVVVGISQDGASSNMFRAFRWTEASGRMTGLGTLNNGFFSGANAVSADGRTVVGFSADGAANDMMRAFRWTEDTNRMMSLGTLNNGGLSEATDVSADGKTIVGFSEDGAFGNQERAFRWTEATNRMESLGTLNNGGMSHANGVSADGRVVVGYSQDGAAGNANRAFRSTQDSGMRSLDSLLSDGGVNLGTIHLTLANAVSSDGLVIVGQTSTNRAFLARLSAAQQAPQAINPGLMDIGNFEDSLSQAAAFSNAGERVANLTINGAHGKPMRAWLNPDENALWLRGDAAWLNGDDFSGYRGLGEIGFGHGLDNGISAQIAFGGFADDASLDSGGSVKSRMLYTVPELGFDLGDQLRVTLTGLYGMGTLDYRRSYLNGAQTDFSEGRSDVTIASLRTRLDWLDAFSLGDAQMTPFVSYAFSRSEQSAYRESGGAFPVSWDAYTDNTQVFRTGIDAVYDLNERLTLLGHIEASYSTGDDPPVTGETIGLSRFSIANAKSGGLGVQAGIGAEFDMGHGVASVMVNGALGANNPAAWIAVSCRVRF